MLLLRQDGGDPRKDAQLKHRTAVPGGRALTLVLTRPRLLLLLLLLLSLLVSVERARSGAGGGAARDLPRISVSECTATSCPT